MILTCPNCDARFRVPANAVGPGGRRVRCTACAHEWVAEPGDLTPEPMAAPAPMRVVAPPRPAAKKPAAAPKPKPKPAPMRAAAPPPPPPMPMPIRAEIMTPSGPPPMDPAMAAATALEAAVAAATSAPSPESEDEPPPDEKADDGMSPQAEEDIVAAAAAASAEPDFKPRARRPAPAPRKRSLFARVATYVAGVLLVAAIGGVAWAAIQAHQVMERFPETTPLYMAFGFTPPPPGDGLDLTFSVPVRAQVGGGSGLIIEGKVTNTRTSAQPVPPLRGSLRDSSDRELQTWQFRAPSAKLNPGETVSFKTEVRLQSTQASVVAITFAAQ